MPNTVVSESKRFCLDKVLCDRELLFNPDFTLILSSFPIQRKISEGSVVGEKKSFPATKKLLQQRRKVSKTQQNQLFSFNVNGQWAFSTCCKLLQNGHWVHTAGCDATFPHYTLAGLGYLPGHPQEDPPQNGSRTALELGSHCLSLPSTAIKHGGVRTEVVISHSQLI